MLVCLFPDHKTIKSVKTGEELILDLYTQQAEQMIFQNSNDTSWSVLWERGARISKKGYPKERDGKLIFGAVTASSAGTYKVLDSQGLALSTTKVAVTGNFPSVHYNLKIKVLYWLLLFPLISLAHFHFTK